MVAGIEEMEYFILRQELKTKLNNSKKGKS